MSPKAPKGKISISEPYDARHVSGVSIPGITNPVAGVQRSNTSTSVFSIQPDTVPTHSFAATGKEEITKPRRANTIAHTLTRPSLRLKTSISRLRARSHSNSPDTSRKPISESVQSISEEIALPGIAEMSTASLRQKPSMSRLRERARSNPAEQARRERDVIPEAVMSFMATPLEKPVPAVKVKQLPPLKLRERSRERAEVKTTMVDLPDHSHRNLPQVQPQPQVPISRRPPPPRTQAQIQQPQPQPRSQPHPPPKPIQAKAQIVTRPKRVDSGTAIDFPDAPSQRKPLGFKEIIAVRSLEQRMALYKRTREYWATADHGLDEWVGKAGNGPRRAVYSHA